MVSVGIASERSTQQHSPQSNESSVVEGLPSPHHKNPKAFKVLVTGQGAFPKGQKPEDGRYLESENSSHLITTKLPSSLPAHSIDNPTHVPIEILNPTSATGASVKTEYAFARKYLQDLWTHHGDEVDLILHLGMADGWQWYSIEQSGWKEGTVKRFDNGFEETEEIEYYLVPDDIGQTYKDLGPCPWESNVPQQLFALEGLDLKNLAQATQIALNEQSNDQEIEVRAHPDPGNYLCGFIAYESLAQAFTNKYTAKTLFCHVPGWLDEQNIENGKRFVCNLISQIAAYSAADETNS